MPMEYPVPDPLDVEQLHNIVFPDPADNYQGINDAIAELPSEGGIVCLKKGTYDVTGTYDDGEKIVVDKPIWITGHGKASVVRAADNTTEVDQGIRIFSVEASGVTFSNFMIDGNWQNNTPISDAKDGHNCQVKLGYKDFKFVNMWSYNGTGDGVETHAAENVIIDSNHIYNCYFDDIDVKAKKAVISNNLCLYQQQRRGITVRVDSSGNNPFRDAVVDGNVIVAGSSDMDFGILIRGEGSRVSVKNNLVNGVNHYCDGVHVRPQDSKAIENLTIKNNDFLYPAYGVRVQAGQNIDIKDNFVKHSSGRGIAIDAIGNLSIDDVEIKHNRIIDNVNNNEGIRVWAYTANLSDIFVENNTVDWIEETGSDYCMSAEVDGQSIDRSYMRNNTLRNYSTAPVNNPGNIGQFVGVVTLPSGSTSVTANHNLGIAPEPHQVSAVPLEGLGSATYWYVDETALTASSLDIAVDADPTKDVDFKWKIDKKAR